MARPEKVIRVLNAAEVRFVLMGTHGIGGYRSEARATQDVDVLVRKRDHRRATEAIQEAYPKLLAKDHYIVTRFIDRSSEKPVIDLMKPTELVLQAVFKNRVLVGDYFIPNLEMALAAKYAAMISPNRPLEKKYTDAGDFLDVVKNNREDLKLARLRRLGELVYKGGGLELMRFVQDALAGRRLEL